MRRVRKRPRHPVRSVNGDRGRRPEVRGGAEAKPDDLAAQEAAEAASSDSLKQLRDGAAKWETAIATVLGLFAISGLIKGPDDFAKVAADWRYLIPWFLGAAVALGLLATFLAAQAAHGLPRRRWAIGEDYFTRRDRSELSTATNLNRAIGAAFLSFALFTIVVGILWFAPRATPSVDLSLLTTADQIVCGEIKGITTTSITVADELTAADVTVALPDLLGLRPASKCPILP